jgi:hypothetical protein
MYAEALVMLLGVPIALGSRSELKKKPGKPSPAGPFISATQAAGTRIRTTSFNTPSRPPKTVNLSIFSVTFSSVSSSFLLLRPAVTLPIEIYSNKRIQEFDDEEADLEKFLRRSRKKKPSR